MIISFPLYSIQAIKEKSVAVFQLLHFGFYIRISSNNNPLIIPGYTKKTGCSPAFLVVEHLINDTHDSFYNHRHKIWIFHFSYL